MNMDFRIWDYDVLIDTILNIKGVVKEMRKRQCGELPEIPKVEPDDVIGYTQETLRKIQRDQNELREINKHLARH